MIHSTSFILTCFINTLDEYVLMVRDIKADENLWELPCGKVDGNTPFVNSLRKIIKKDIGMNLERLDLVGIADINDISLDDSLEKKWNQVYVCYKADIAKIHKNLKVKVRPKNMKWISKKDLPKFKISQITKLLFQKAGIKDL